MYSVTAVRAQLLYFSTFFCKTYLINIGRLVGIWLHVAMDLYISSLQLNIYEPLLILRTAGFEPACHTNLIYVALKFHRPGSAMV